MKIDDPDCNRKQSVELKDVATWIRISSAKTKTNYKTSTDKNKI